MQNYSEAPERPEDYTGTTFESADLCVHATRTFCCCNCRFGGCRDYDGRISLHEWMQLLRDLKQSFGRAELNSWLDFLTGIVSDRKATEFEERSKSKNDADSWVDREMARSLHESAL